jgi:hypothetical protein
VRPERRRAVIDEMVAYTPQALQVLAGCLVAPLPRVREQVLDAFTAWLKLTGGCGITGAMLMDSPLVRWDTHQRVLCSLDDGGCCMQARSWGREMPCSLLLPAAGPPCLPR